MARVCILRGDGARLYFARARRWRNAPALFRAPRGERAGTPRVEFECWGDLRASGGAGAHAQQLRFKFTVRNAYKLSWQTLDAQISNYSRGGFERGLASALRPLAVARPKRVVRLACTFPNRHLDQ